MQPKVTCARIRHVANSCVSNFRTCVSTQMTSSVAFCSLSWGQLHGLLVFCAWLSVLPIFCPCFCDVWSFQITVGSRFYYWKKCQFKSGVISLKMINELMEVSVGKWWRLFLNHSRVTSSSSFEGTHVTITQAEDHVLSSPYAIWTQSFLHKILNDAVR